VEDVVEDVVVSEVVAAAADQVLAVVAAAGPALAADPAAVQAVPVEAEVALAADSAVSVAGRVPVDSEEVVLGETQADSAATRAVEQVLEAAYAAGVMAPAVRDSADEEAAPALVVNVAARERVDPVHQAAPSSMTSSACPRMAVPAGRASVRVVRADPVWTLAALGVQVKVPALDAQASVLAV